jgi:Gram-negative bacterial TonB protein C-terminal
MLVGRLRRQALWLAACLALVLTNHMSAGTTAGRPGSQIYQLPVPVWGDSSPWARYFRQLQDTMALRWYEEITYYDHLYVYSLGSVTARFTVTPDGTFHDPQILSNTSNPPMADATIRAIRKAWIQRFPAAVLTKAPEGLVIEQTFRFWDNDPTEYGLASSYPQLLTRRNPEVGGAYNLNLRVFPDLSIFHFQSRILEATPANSRLAAR